MTGQASLWPEDEAAVEGPGATPRGPEALPPGRDRVLYDMGRRDGIAWVMGAIARAMHDATEETTETLSLLQSVCRDRHEEWTGVAAAGLAAVLAGEVTR